MLDFNQLAHSGVLARTGVDLGGEKFPQHDF